MPSNGPCDQTSRLLEIIYHKIRKYITYHSLAVKESIKDKQQIVNQYYGYKWI